MRFFHIIIIGIIMSSYTAIAGVNSDFIITNYSINEGLAHKSVTCMIQDKDGFVWIGTTNGLSRFDGYSFKNFFHDNDDTTSLRGNIIKAISEGINGNIWISTDYGIEYYDKKQEAFYKVKLPDNQIVDFTSNISIDNKGYVWAYTSLTNFIAINPYDGSIAISGLKVPKVFFDDKDLSIYSFTVINDIIWIASNKGIIKYHYLNGDIEYIYKGFLNHCYSIQKTENNTLVFTFLIEGIYILDTQSKTGKWVFNNTQIDNTKNVTFYVSTVTSDNTIWVGTSNGLYLKTNHQNNSDLLVNKLFQGDIISCIYTDKEDNVLVGTYEKGFFLVKQNNKKFETKSNLNKDKGYNPTINSMQVFKDESLIFTNNNGVYYCKDYNNLTEGSAIKIKNGSTTISFYKDENSCFINDVDSLFTYDNRTKKLQQKIISPSTQYVYEDANGITWIGSWIGVINGYDKQNKLKHTIILDKYRYIHIFMIIAGENGSLWLVTSSLGLIHITNPTSKKPTITKYLNTPNKNSISINHIHCIHKDKIGNFWIGTCGGGLNKFDVTTKKFEIFTMKNGLKSNVVESVISDDDGNIWIASEVLTKYDIKNKTFVHFTKSDGIKGGFILKSAVKLKNGKLLFGTLYGILIVNPKALQTLKKYSTPFITELKIRGLPIKVGQKLEDKIPYLTAITYTNSIDIPYEFNSFALEFASIHLTESHNIVYEYMMEEIDKSWIPADTKNRMAAYSALQPGKYTFKVKAGNGNGMWSEPRILVIHIIPPWWKTWWFIIGGFLMLFIIVASFLYYRFKQIKKQSELLDLKVLERTNELLFANKKLHANNEQLKENQIVIEMRNLDLNEALDAKDELIKILGHDFKNPLTGIIGIADLLKAENIETNQKKIKHFANLIHSSATSLINQMITVLDWAQSLNKNLSANPIEINIETLVDDAISLVKESALQKQITISKQLDFEYNAFIDARMISTVFRNLLSNSIKYSKIGSSILVIIQELDNTIDVIFIDTGIGMNEEIVNTLFTSDKAIISRTGTSNERGTGLGLQMCKTFVEKNAGSISVISEEHKGTIFSVLLPKGKNKAVKTNRIYLENKIQTPVIEHNEMFTILIIDDNLEIREVIQGLFDTNYSVIKAEDGNEGLYLAQQSLPDIIICDIILPGIQGYEICKSLKNNDLTKHIPVILISSQIGHDIETKSFEAGANDFIQKPFNPYILQQKVLSLLDLKKQLKDKISEENGANKPSYLPMDYDNKIIQKVIEFIEINISDSELDIESVVDSIGVSRTQLWRIFKKTSGKTLGDYIRDFRLDKAAEMLKTGKYRISEVAYEVGYSDAKYFAKNFQKKYGVSPSQYANKK